MYILVKAILKPWIVHRKPPMSEIEESVVNMTNYEVKTCQKIFNALIELVKDFKALYTLQFTCSYLFFFAFFLLVLSNYTI